MSRFLLLALPLVLLILAVSGFVHEQWDLVPAATVLAPRSVARPEPLATTATLAGWMLETLGLTALFLLVREGSPRPWWVDGVLTGAMAWVFRGPLLVLTVLAVTRFSQAAWWALARSQLPVYLACGLLLGFLGWRLSPREPSRE